MNGNKLQLIRLGAPVSPIRGRRSGNPAKDPCRVIRSALNPQTIRNYDKSRSACREPRVAALKHHADCEAALVVSLRTSNAESDYKVKVRSFRHANPVPLPHSR